MEKIINGKKYLVVSDSECIKKEDETQLEYTIRFISDIYKKSTHWLCNRTVKNYNITKNKLYTFKNDATSGEFVIIDDKNELSLVWLISEGDLLIEL